MQTSATIKAPSLSIKAQTLAALAAIAAAVALPQLFHAVGAAAGLGASLGAALLPMHLPILLVGLLAGPWAGAAAGLLAPLASFALSGMPSASLLPFMVIELCVYGLTAGLLQNARLPYIGKIAAAQAAGRAARALAILLAVYAFKSEGVGVSVIWTSIAAGLPGLALQWCLLPLICRLVYKRGKNAK